MPFCLEAAILSRIRSPVTSRSNWAKDSRTLRVKRPMDVVVLNCWVTETNETPAASKISTILAKSANERVSVDDNHIDGSGLDVGEKLFEGRAFDRSTGIPAIVVQVGKRHPTLVFLTLYISLAGLPLRM